MLDQNIPKMPMKVWRVCLVGFGVAAEQIHLPAYNKIPGFKIVAIVDPIRARQEAAKASTGISMIFSNLADALLWGMFDVIDLSTPPVYHAEQLKIIAEAGFHCICEKPLIDDDPHRLIKRFTDAGLIVQFVDEWKYAQAMQRAKLLINQNKIGLLQKVKIDCLRKEPAQGTNEWIPDWRKIRNLSGGGILIDYGWHLFYVVRFFTNYSNNIDHLSCNIRIPKGWEVEDQANIQYKSNGCHIDIFMSWSAHHRLTCGQIKGSEGILTFDESFLRIRNHEGQIILEESMATALASKAAQSKWFETTLINFRDCLNLIRNPNDNHEEAIWVWKAIKLCTKIGNKCLSG